jgi:hypothetical protein
MKIILVSYLDEAKEVKEFKPELEFDLVVNNHPSSIQRLEGLKVEKAYVTASVLVGGILPELMDILLTNFIRQGIGGHDAFEVVA